MHRDYVSVAVFVRGSMLTRGARLALLRPWSHMLAVCCFRHLGRPHLGRVLCDTEVADWVPPRSGS